MPLQGRGKCTGVERGAEPVVRGTPCLRGLYEPASDSHVPSGLLRPHSAWRWHQNSPKVASSMHRLEFVQLLGVAPWATEGSLPLQRRKVASSLKISGDSETGSGEQRISHLQFCGKGSKQSLAYQLEIRPRTTGSGMPKGYGPTCLRKARGTFYWSASAGGLGRMLLG